MMMDKDQDLGLSLSLSSATSSSSSAAVRLVPPQLAVLRPSSSSSSSPSFHPFPYSSSCHPKPQWSGLLLCHQDKRPMLDMPLLRGIDVNRAPSSAAGGATIERDSEDDGGASSPNSTVSSVSGPTKRTERDLGGATGEDIDVERGSSRGPVSDEEDGEGSRKKLRLSKDQSAVLEESFKEHNTLNPKQKMALAKQLNLRPRQVEVWFQNRRARTKLKQTEVDCEFLKRCCENLTEENRRLQKEVMELRALKLSPQFYMHMTPPTTLTMCPSCERVSNSTAATGIGPANSSQPASTTPTTPLQSQLPERHHQFLHRHRPASPAPWAPIPLRPSFLDAPPQRS